MPKKKEISVELEKDQENVNLEEKLRKENEELKSKLNELEKMLQKLMGEKTEIKELQEEQLPIIPPNKLVNVTSLFFGGMTLRGLNNRPYRFERFGITRPISFEDLTHIVNNHRRLAEEVVFFIHDKDVLKVLGLEENYQIGISKTVLENLITLDEKQIEEIYLKLSPTLKETVQDIVIHGIRNSDPRYKDRNKIDLLSKLSGKNLYQIAHHELLV